jgi:hypothetical protein
MVKIQHIRFALRPNKAMQLLPTWHYFDAKFFGQDVCWPEPFFLALVRSSQKK